MHTLDGDHEYTVPFECHQVVYYAHKKKWWKKNSQWVISKCEVVGIWATNVCGVTLNDKMHIDPIRLCEDEFKYLFTDREEAIDYCIKKNAHAKVKVYGG